MSRDSQSVVLVANRYRLEDQLGKGGMGAVFRAVDRLAVPPASAVVALKQVTADVDSGDTMDDTLSYHVALAREFKVLASLRHPHIISVLDYGFDGPPGSDQRQPFVTMELLKNAQSFVEAVQGRPITQQALLLIQLLQALAYLHRRNVLHRDLKPANVLVTHGGDGQPHVHVLDFGLAMEPEQAQEVAGTLAYMAPEVLMYQEPTPAADLYAIGVMMHEVFCGGHPFNLAQVGTLINDIMMTPVNVAALDDQLRQNLAAYSPANIEVNIPALVTLVERLLKKTPEERYGDAYRVIQDLCDALALPVPTESAAIRESFLQAAKFIGRDRQMAQLQDALKRAFSGRGALWLIGGESGVGKTRLLDELRIQALVEGAVVLRGKAVDGGLSYQLWRDPLRGLLLTTPVDEVDASILKDLVPDIERLLERRVADAPAVDGSAYIQRLHGALTSLFEHTRVPVLLLLEDLQWAAEGLEALRILSTMVDELPLLMVGSYRHDEAPDLPDKLPGANLMRLERLSDEHIAALSASMLGEVGRRPDVVDLLRRETEGNAFFLVEVVRALADEAGRLAAVGTGGLPTQVFAGGVQKVIERRLARIPMQGRDWLTLAAAAGRQIDLNVMAELVKARYGQPQPEMTLDDWITLCANSAVLERVDGHWLFAHDKLRQAMLERITDAARPGLHQQVAEAMETAYADNPDQAAALARHWQIAGNLLKERHYTEMAGDHALRVSLYSDAVSHYTRALQLLTGGAGDGGDSGGTSGGSSSGGDDDRARRANLLLKLADAQSHISEMDAAKANAEAGLALYRELGDSTNEARALKLLGDITWLANDFDAALAYCEQSIALYRRLNQERGIASASNRIGMVWFGQGKYAEAAARFEESLALARAQNDALEMGTALNNLGTIAFAQGNFPQAAAYFEEGLQIARASGERRRIALTLLNLGGAAGEQKDYARAQTYFQETLRICREIGNKRGIGLALNNLGIAAELQGKFTEAIGYFEEQLALETSVKNQGGIVLAHTGLGHVYRKLGIVADSATHYRQALAGASALEAVPLMLDALRGLALIHEDAAEAVRWLSLVVTHEASYESTRQDAQNELTMWRYELSGADYDAAVEQGKTLDIKAMVQTILTQGG